MYIITFVAVNNDTYEDSTFFLQCPILEDGEQFDEECSEEYEYEKLWKEIPSDCRERVEESYDGVWEPQLDSIEVYDVTKVEVWKQ